MAQKAAVVFDNNYRFVEGDVVSAILETNGKLTLKDGGLTIYQSWADYVKEVTGDVPAKGGETEIVEQLALTLGTPQVIGENVVPRRAAQPPSAPLNKENNEMAAEAVAKAPAKKAAPTKGVAKKVSGAKGNGKEATNECQCGCGTATRGNFAPGHDARVHGWQKKIANGQMKMGEIPAIAQRYIKQHA